MGRDMESLLTVKEVAQMLRLSQQTVYKLVNEGAIPAIRVGTQWRFDPAEVRAQLLGSRQRNVPQSRTA